MKKQKSNQNCLQIYNIINFLQNMEDQIFNVRVILCEKCYEHQQLEQHSQFQYFQKYNELKSELSKHNIKIVKNIPFKYMVKLPDTKYSTKRYLNQYTNKIQQFPERGAFQVYFLNILIYSKRQLNELPNVQLLSQVIIKIKNQYMINPLLPQYQEFRNIQLQWNSKNAPKQCLFGCLTLPSKLEKQTNGETKKTSLIFHLPVSKLLKKKDILPYSIYALRERHKRIGNIYCPERNRIQQHSIPHISYKSPSSRPQTSSSNFVKTVRKNKNIVSAKKSNNVETKEQKDYRRVNYSQLFNLIKLGNQEHSLKQQDNPTQIKAVKEALSSTYNDIQKVARNSGYKNSRNFSATIQKKVSGYSNSDLKIPRTSEQIHVINGMYVNQAFNDRNYGKNGQSQIKNKPDTLQLQNPLLYYKGSNPLKKSNFSQGIFLNNSKDDQSSSQSSSSKIGSKRQSSDSRRFNQQQFIDQKNPIDEIQTKRIHQSRQSEQYFNKINDCKAFDDGKTVYQVQEHFSPHVLNQNNNSPDQIQACSSFTKRQSASSLRSISRNSKRQKNCQDLAQFQQSPKTKLQKFSQHRQSKLSMSSRFKSQQIEQLQNLTQNENENRRLPSQSLEPQQSIPYEQAGIITKFSQKASFDLNLYQQNYKNKNSLSVAFEFDQLFVYPNAKISTIRSLYSKQSLKLFPSLFSQLKGQESILKQVINTIIKNNPQIILRLFENPKYINPTGIYGVWLRNQYEQFCSVLVNDQFLFDEYGQPVYGCKDHEGAIWFMILQKALAKIYGGYRKLREATLRDLFSSIIGCPTIQLKSLNPHTLYKVLNDRLFFSKKATIYTLSTPQNGPCKKIERIIAFHYDKENPLKSIFNFQTTTSRFQSIQLQDFLIQFNFLTLVFFNYNFFYNQIPLPQVQLQNAFFTIDLINLTDNNLVYFSLANFNPENRSKALVYRKKTQKQLKKHGKNLTPLEEQQIKYQYVGEIEKRGSFFFEFVLQTGEYICLIQSQNKNNKNSKVLLYSEKPVNFGNVTTHQDQNKNSILNINELFKGSTINFEGIGHSTISKFGDTLLGFKKKQFTKSKPETISKWKVKKSMNKLLQSSIKNKFIDDEEYSQSQESNCNKQNRFRSKIKYRKN